MNDTLRKLPIGIQTFEKLIEGGYIYVDKSALIRKLASSQTPCLLTRPRSFGKSLLLSTLAAYFEGRKELFEGFAIAHEEQDWKHYPVLHLDLNAENYDSPQALTAILNRHLCEWEQKYGKGEEGATLSCRFASIISCAAKQAGTGVVVLVDEYDKPLLQTLKNSALHDDYLRTLRAFYEVLKSSDRYLRFVFLAGTTRFASLGVFGDLNQCNDLSLHPAYATLCGFTTDELIRYFSPEVGQLAIALGTSPDEVTERMLRQYGGYHFHPKGSGVMNPFSVLHAFDKMEPVSYWFRTGTPALLVELLQESDYDLLAFIEGIETNVSSFTDYHADANNPLPLIYQNGYLTIRDYDPEFQLYRLGFPNDEVKYGFLNYLLPYYTSVNESAQNFHISRLVENLRAGDTDGFLNRIKVFFSDFPCKLNENNECLYQLVLCLVSQLMGQFVQVEVRSISGGVRTVAKTSKFIYVFVFNLQGTAEETLQQMEKDVYPIPHQDDGRKMANVAVEFSAVERNISRWIFKYRL